MNEHYVTKKQLVVQLEARFPDLTSRDIEEAVNLILEAIVHRVEQGGRAEIRGVGSFNRKLYRSRKARNPKNGEAVALPAKYHFRCKPSSTFHALLNPEQEVASDNG